MSVPFYTPYDDSTLYLPMMVTSAMTPPIEQKLTGVVLDDATYNELEIYSNNTYEKNGSTVTVLPDSSYNFDGDWVPDFTVLDASFNKTLEAGQIKGIQGQKVTEVILQRSTLRDGFYEADEIATFKTNENGEVYVVFNDYIIEAGVLYKYSLLPISTLKDAYGNVMSELRAPIVGEKYCIADFEGCWLIGPNRRQVKIDFNPVISNMRHVVKDSVVETLGSKYPFIIRNSSVNYRQFDFSGTMTVEMDVENKFIGDGSYTQLFCSDENIDEKVKAIIEMEYRNYIPTIVSSGGEKNNYIIEREFRNRLIDWLNDGEPKVFKSDTEGLILCKLTDVNLVPIQTLGRMLYNFSCTVTEIGEATKQSLINYRIIPQFEEQGGISSAYANKLQQL